MGKYDKHSKNDLIKHIEDLEQQLKSTKYGLYWDKSIEQEEAKLKLLSNIPVLKQVNNDDLK